MEKRLKKPGTTNELKGTQGPTTREGEQFSRGKGNNAIAMLRDQLKKERGEKNQGGVTRTHVRGRGISCGR